MAMLFVDTCRIQCLCTINADERAEDVRLLELDLDEISQPFLDVLYCLLDGGGGQAGGQWNLAVEVFLSGHGMFPLRLPNQRAEELLISPSRRIRLAVRDRYF